jgi:hypothetical protein
MPSAGILSKITGLDDVFDFLNEWPQDKRNVAYDILSRYCHEAAGGRWPISAVRMRIGRQSRIDVSIEADDDLMSLRRTLRLKRYWTA